MRGGRFRRFLRLAVRFVDRIVEGGDLFFEFHRLGLDTNHFFEIDKGVVGIGPFGSPPLVTGANQSRGDFSEFYLHYDLIYKLLLLVSSGL